MDWYWIGDKPLHEYIYVCVCVCVFAEPQWIKNLEKNVKDIIVYIVILTALPR